MRHYREEELLTISEIQHYCFCPRQWQLITLEQIWHDNHLTALGQILHRRVDQPELSARVGDTITMRRVPLISYTLGLYGLSDAVELTPQQDRNLRPFRHSKYPGEWRAAPVEYKRGKPKYHLADKLQLCAQVIALEEMYQVSISEGYLYYGEMRHRLLVEMEDSLRAECRSVARKMHEAFSRRAPIPSHYTRQCRSCSLLDDCLPRIASHRSAKSYLRHHDILIS